VKVLLVTSMFPPYFGGGISSHVVSLATRLRASGHEPWVLTSRRGKPVAADEVAQAPPGVRVVYARDFLSMATRIGRFVRSEGFDVVHMHAFNAMGLAPLCHGGRAAIVFTLHSDSANYLASVRGWTRGHPLYRLFLRYERSIVRFADATIAVSNRMEEYGRRIGIRRIVRIPNAVDPDYWTPSVGPRDGRPPTILVPRMHVPKNGIEYAIEAMGAIAGRARGARMLVTGDGPLRPRLEAAARRVGADITFPGHVSQAELRSLYRDVDLVLIPSVTTSGTQENTSIAALEAMACGRPVVATDIGGLPEVIRSGVDGILVAEKDPNAIAEAALAVLTDGQLAQRLGEEARRQVVREFSTSAWAERVVDVYRAAIQDRGSVGSAA